MPSQTLLESVKGVPFMRLKYFILAIPLMLLMAGISASYFKNDLVTAYNTYRPMLLDGGSKAGTRDEHVLHVEDVGHLLGA